MIHVFHIVRMILRIKTIYDLAVFFVVDTKTDRAVILDSRFDIVYGYRGSTLNSCIISAKNRCFRYKVTIQGICAESTCDVQSIASEI